jgi:outer membrane protein OmpA-like peptidoglycan-associated protein
MAANLMDTVKGMLTSEAVGKAADQAGESPEGMRKAMSGAIPATFAGLTQCASNPGGAMRIFGALTAEGGASPQGLMGTIFGNRTGAIGDAIASGSGVKSGAASHALIAVVPMVVGVLGKHVASNRLNPAGLSQLLSSHKKAIAEDPNTPPGLAGALGQRDLMTEREQQQEDITERRVGVEAGGRAPRQTLRELRRTGEPQPSGQKPRWGLLLPVALLAGLLIWGISAATRGHAPRGGVTAPQPTLPSLPAPPNQAPAGTAGPAGAGHLALPGGKALDVAPSSAEAEMAHSLADHAVALPRTFDFENLNFEYGSAAITPGSAKTIDDMAAMLQAYPSSRVRIEGHTDSTGGATANQPLSEARATSVKQALVAKGVAADRIETSGAAASRPAPGAPSQTAPVNRRADVVLLAR